ncbi:hypothetical protein GCM10028796_50430 [Ramlibacter monticola]|uniref:Tandem-95 repeat protein n=1 Tax=Ramlibacter monticola TaxID=1926872 RepID=A0A936YZF1_9BURK|nr:Ig-like domain-containing protein [Ramlibacter monticola]MBL0390790.1 hypothetical protein [Ramlibacter monticola]
MKPKRNMISAAVVLAMAAASATTAYAGLERLGPIDRSPQVGGFPAWFQDKSGITMEFCAPSTQGEVDGGWCLLLPGDVTIPEQFPSNYFDEHFYFATDNVLLDAGTGLKATLVLALESAFVNGAPVDGDQMVFTRLRVNIPRLPFDGDYRVITPFSDVSYYDQVAGGRIFDTLDIGTSCPTTFECALNGTLGPFLLPSASAGGAEVPPMPDLQSAPAGTDPFYDAAVAAGAAPAANPGTGKKYIADPGRVGAVTGSPLPPYTSYEIDSSGATSGTPVTRNHNTFRIEVRVPSPTHDGHVFYTADGETNFTMMGRLMTGVIPGNVSNTRSTYKADANGALTDLDVFAQASPTVQARIPGQPVQPLVTPVISFYDQACGGALTTDPATGLTKVNAGPYTAPVGTAHDMGNTGHDFWGQSSPGAAVPSHVCIEDTSSRNAAGQVVPSYTLVPVTDHVIINTAHYVGPENGTLTVAAVSSDPTATLTLAGYGPGDAATPGVSIGVGAGAGLELSGTSAQVLALKAPPSQVNVVSSKGGAVLRKVDTAHGAAMLVGQPAAVNDAASVNEDCSAEAATICPAGQGVQIDLLANDQVLLNGVMTSLRDAVSQNLATVTVTAQAPRLGLASVSTSGVLTYIPNANANGIDNVNYTVTVDGQVSNQAVAAITITPVNDKPVAGNQTINGVVAKTNVMNLLLGATDPDGATDVKDAVLTTWPAQLGPQPTPVNGSISFSPNATGNFTFGYQVKDAAGLLSDNTATGTVTVVAAEDIQFTVQDYRAAKLRWTVGGTDLVRAGQRITIAYANGTSRNGEICNGTDAIPACVVGTAVVDGTGAWLFDQIIAGGSTQDPRGSYWPTNSRPTSIRAFSSAPVLGGSRTTAITFR